MFSHQFYPSCWLFAACLAITRFSCCLEHCKSINTLHFFCLIFITTSITTSPNYQLNTSSYHLFTTSPTYLSTSSSLQPSIHFTKSPTPSTSPPTLQCLLPSDLFGRLLRSPIHT